MHRSWTGLLDDVVRALRPRVVVEVGAGDGRLTALLAEASNELGATLHAVDPSPRFDPETLDGEIILHEGPSVAVIPDIADIDLLVLDGDPNYFTVLNELRLAEERAVGDRHVPPVIALANVAGPHRDRDAYYEPERIPERHRQEVGAGWPAAATTSGGERNGVRAGLREFLDTSQTDWVVRELPEPDGLALLAPTELVNDNGLLADLLERAQDEAWLRERRAEIAPPPVAAVAPPSPPPPPPPPVPPPTPVAVPEPVAAPAPPDLQALVRGEFERLMGAAATDVSATAREREHELEARLRAETRALEDARARLASLETELDQLRSEQDVAAGHRRRMQQDVADVREMLGHELDQQRAEAERLRAELTEARSAARSDRAEHELALRTAQDAQAAGAEARALLDALTGERVSLETRLADAGTELEVVRAERDALQAERGRLDGELAAARSALADTEATGESTAEQLRTAEEARADAERRLAELDAELADVTQRAEARVTAAEELAAAAQAQLEQALREPRVALPEPTPAPEPAPERRLVSVATDTEITPGALDPLAREYEPRKAFLRRYLHTLNWDQRPFSGEDPLALPGAVDHRGMLLDADEQGAERPSIDIVVCVHNALEDVRRCLWSLLAKSDRRFRLILVNDGSQPDTTDYLREVVAANPKITLIHNETAQGYTVAANLGMRETTADYVVILNSDTIVTYGWMARFLEAGASDERIGIIGPLSNAASHQSVPRLRDAGRWATNPLPGWMTPDAMAAVVARASTGRYPRLPFINGFCYVIRRAVFDAIGFFDEERFASGYSEENDFSYRASQAGFELAVADQGYVFHAKSKSFTVEGRNQLAGANYEIFLEKHGREKILELVRGMESNTSLAPVRHAVEDATSTVSSAAAVLFDRVEPLTVVFILPGLGDGGSGGSHSIYQEVRGMRQLGIPARIALVEKAMPRALAAYEDAADVFQTFSDLDDLVEKTRDADVLSATHFKSVAMLAHVREARSDFLPAYYIQDYEPFFASKDSDSEQEAIESYTAIDDMLLFAKTHWLCNIVGHVLGLHVAKVEPSIDEQLYVPTGRVRRDSDPIRVVGMVRPRTPRRQPFATVDALDRLQRELDGQVEVATFGCHADELAAVTDSRTLRDRHLGLLTRQRVARTLAEADVFVDLSMYQAFGRTVLEAMACGCTAVAPRLGGAWEFAEHDENLVAVDTLDDDDVFEALRALVTDRDRLRRLQTNARATAARYSIVRAALSEYVAFENEHARRFGATFRRADARRGS